ncbi:MAG: hypothetical protein A2219_07075 [Elusimicrobia bacterium RIFOXYA2_FULL_50_26]|nr:MAG: hypothetical protein A2219_07075 [Elusimicrobia bacterium RIFOXYA2_FULL_50_26]OGS22513.1 MAG: hypothetical protein A2314_08435 [Elusimicrobia bacterium RIFOXYB2_FULL_50_12]
MNQQNSDWNDLLKLGSSDHKTDTSDLWIVPYADFMSVLMIFFLLMYAFAYSYKSDDRFKRIVTNIQQEMGGKIDTELVERMIEQERTGQMVSKLDEMIEKLKLNNMVTVNSNTEHIKIVFANPVLFDPGKYRLKNESRELLRDMAQIILKATDNEIVVEGHTDNVPLSGTGRFRSNWELSVARAMEVVKYLVEEEGLAPGRLAAAGYGEFRPILPNDTEENRAQNRRIEIDIATGKKTANIQ